MSDTTINSSEYYAHLFTAIHDSLAEESAPAILTESVGRERRRSQRFPFTTIQMAAYYDGESLPPIDEMETIHCYDISRGGISYFAENEPHGDTLVIILQLRGHYSCLLGSIKYVRPVHWNRKDQFLIGCEFIDRIEIARA